MRRLYILIALTVIDICGSTTRHGVNEKQFKTQSAFSLSRVKAKILMLILHFTLLLCSRAEQQNHKEPQTQDLIQGIHHLYATRTKC